MNFSPEKCKKLEKKFQTLPLACFSIVAEYVGLFFISSECSIQSSFLLFCKILVYVGFAVVNNSAVSIRLSIATYQIFFSQYHVRFQKIARFRFQALFSCYLWGNIVICINSKFCEKCSNTDLRVSAKLPPEPNRCGLIAFSECERACPYLYIHQGASSEPGLPVTLSFISSLVDKSPNMTLRSTSKYLSKSSRRIQL